jgi:putative intracellular protease/amidase
VYSRSQKNWQAYVVEDGALITGQNPASAATVASVFAGRLN